MGDGDVAIDVYALPVGIRTVRVDGTRFLINEEPFYFTGFGKHEDSPVRGKGHDDAFMVHDFALLDWLGANSFRTSHYPYAEEVLEYADRHGIVVIDETPAVGINSGLAGGVFGAEPFTTFSPDTIGPATQEAHRQAIRELVARDKNHPCVVLWTIANEPESVTPEARAYFEPLAAEARRLDPSRPIAFANVMGATPDVDVITDLFDVVMLNRYFGWYAAAGDLAAAERRARRRDPCVDRDASEADHLHRVRRRHVRRPAQRHADARGRRSTRSRYSRCSTASSTATRPSSASKSGTSPTSRLPPGVLRADGNKKGVFTRERRPKAAAHMLRRRWRRLP